jgi:hypothetical protein
MTGFSYAPPAAPSPSLTTTSLTPVVYTGTTYATAQADADVNCADLVLLSDGSRIESGRVTWTGHGLTVGVYYFLSQATAGAITPTQPASGLAQRILFVEDSNTVHIDIEPAGQAAAVDSQVFSASKIVYLNNDDPASATVFSEATSSGVLVHNAALMANPSYRYITPSGANFIYSGGVYVAYTFPASVKHVLFVRKGTTQAIANLAGSIVTGWDAPLENTSGSAFNPATGVYTVSRAGFYSVRAAIEFQSSAYTTAGESRSVNFWIGGNRLLGVRNNIQAGNTGQINTTVGSFGPMWMAAGTTIHITAQHQEPTPQNINPFAASNHFCVTEH